MRHIKTLFSAVRIGSDQFVSLTVDVDDFHVLISLEVLAKLGDVDVHRTGVEIVVINPDSLQRIVTLQDFVGMSAKKSEQFALLGRQLRL